MTTTALGYDRGDEPGEVTIAAGGAITPEIQVTYEDVLTRDQVLLGIEKIKLQLLAADFPR